MPEGPGFPPLILVTTGPGGDLVALEGHARLTAFMLARDRLPPELEVLAGSSPTMTRWALAAGAPPASATMSRRNRARRTPR